MRPRVGYCAGVLDGLGSHTRWDWVVYRVLGSCTVGYWVREEAVGSVGRVIGSWTEPWSWMAMVEGWVRLALG